MAPSGTALVDGVAMVEKTKPVQERERWDKKIEFLLAVVGFAVDLGNVWRFPYVCFNNGGGAFLLPYLVMLIFCGLPLFYMELALGQFQRCGCLTVWNRICPAFKGIGFAIIVIATYISWYYNTIIAWCVYYFFSSMRADVPWKTCNNEWNIEKQCMRYPTDERYNDSTKLFCFDGENSTSCIFKNQTQTPTEQYFEREVLGLQYADGINRVGGVNWIIALCLLGVFVLVYFAMWKGIKSSGKFVWVTATMPYVVLLILLIRGCMLEGSLKGIIYYVTPVWSEIAKKEVWIAATAQIFFSLGPGFGVLLALSSYNKLNNNCYKDALITSSINCFTSFFAGFAVFAVLGHMATIQGKEVRDVARSDVGLIFIVYPEAISTLQVSPVWAMLFFLMFITLGLDTTFGGLEAICTGILDEWPILRKHRKLFVLFLMMYCFIGALATTTYGGIHVVQLLDSYVAPIALIFVVFLEAVSVSWLYGVERFSDDIKSMLGFRPGIFWRICWKFLSPAILLFLFVMSLIDHQPMPYADYAYPQWAIAVGWLIVMSSLSFIPGYFIYILIITPGTFLERLRSVFIPVEVPDHGYAEPVPV